MLTTWLVGQKLAHPCGNQSGFRDFMCFSRSHNWEVSRFSNLELSILSSTVKTGFSSVQSLSRVWLFATPWTAACQASLSITNPQSLIKLMSIESVMPSNHLILCRPLLLPPSIFPSIRVFSNESVLQTRWTKFQLQHQSFQWIFRTDFL